MKRTGPLSWLLSHIHAAAWELWRDLVDIINCFRPKPPLPQRQRKEPPAWLEALPIYHPDRSCSLSPSQELEWAEISKHLDMPPAVPHPRREQP